MILYSRDGMPTEVPAPLLNNYYVQGYTKQPRKPLPDPERLRKMVIKEPSPVIEKEGKSDAEKEIIALNFLNIAPMEQLINIRGIGRSTAEKIVAARIIQNREQLEKIPKWGDWASVIEEINAEVK